MTGSKSKWEMAGDRFSEMSLAFLSSAWGAGCVLVMGERWSIVWTFGISSVVLFVASFACWWKWASR